MMQNVVDDMQEVIREVVPILQEARHQRYECQQVACDLQTVTPLLEDILRGRAPLKVPLADSLRKLVVQVRGLRSLVEGLRDRSWIKRAFTSSTLRTQLRESISTVRNSSRSLFSVQLQIARELAEENAALTNTLRVSGQRQADQRSLANGEESIVSKSKALLDDLVLRSQTVLVPITEWKPLADLLTGLDNQADAAALVNFGVISFLVRLLEGNGESAIVARALENIIRLDPTSSPSLATTRGIPVLCQMLQSGENSTSFDDVAVLELLALASEAQSNKMEIVRHRGVPPLVTASSRGTGAKQEMALTTLLNLSREIHGPDSDDLFVLALATTEVCRCVLDIAMFRGENSSSEKAVVMAVSIIRNISLLGEPARAILSQGGRGAISILLDLIQRHDAVASADVVRTSVVALERFTTMPEGRVAIIHGDGVEAITKVLRLSMDNAQTKKFAARILVNLTKGEDRQLSRDACSRILKAGTMMHLESMLECEHIRGTQSLREVQNQPCLLLKHLLDKAPSKSDVCTAIRDSGIVSKLLLLKLKSNGHHSAVNTVLEELKKSDSQIRDQIRNFRPSS